MRERTAHVLFAILVFAVALFVGREVHEVIHPPACSATVYKVWQINHQQNLMIRPTIAGGGNDGVVNREITACRWERVGPSEYHFFGNTSVIALSDVVGVME